MAPVARRPITGTLTYDATSNVAYETPRRIPPDGIRRGAEITQTGHGSSLLERRMTYPKTECRRPWHQHCARVHASQRTACPRSEARLPPRDQNPGNARYW